jgi:flagellar biosynthesis/type III secretory pathway protein FliH
LWSKVLKPHGITWQAPLPPEALPSASPPTAEALVESPESAYRRGYEAGKADGMREAEARTAAALAAAREAIADVAQRLDGELAAGLERLARQIADAALAVAERVVARRLMDPEALAARVAAAVARRPTGSVLRAYVSARAASAVAERLAPLGVAVEGVADLAGGDFRLEVEEGLLDGSLDTALQEIREALLAELGGGEP